MKQPRDIAEIVDLARYPIGEPSLLSGGVVERCRAELAEDGACQLDGFTRPAATQAVLEEAELLSGKAFRTDATHNAYFTEMTTELTGEDPRAMSLHSSKRALGFNYCGASSPLRTLYEWDGLVAFLKEVLQLPELYHDADPVGACSVMFYDEGDELGWHFDNSEFAVTLMLQECLEGGEFEYVPGLRTAEDENLAGVGAVLKGDRGPVRSLHAAPGTLTLFRGRHSLHRVSPVRGATRRVNAVLAYASTPGHRLTPLNRRLFYGADEDKPSGENGRFRAAP
jgi:alkylated DNA repair dioxygenase AlkB